MAFLDKKDLKTGYTTSKQEARIWREDYPAYERLANNDLMDGLDPNLPEVNDGSLAASLFKLPKRIVSTQLGGRVVTLDRDEAWMTELANIVWTNEIIPNANTQAPFHRKWKDAVRKAAIYGSVPLITIFVDKDGKRHSDFIVGQPQDVTLETGKVSDYDADVQYWDVYFTKLQLENMLEQAQQETKDSKKSGEDGYNRWDIPAIEAILKTNDLEERDPQDVPRQEQDKNVRPQGYKFCIAVQKGVEAPFYMYHKNTDQTIREWANPDPTGDSCIHFLYCYQDFINPYGIGIVKLAGGTQNVLDYMRQADVLATQLGLRPPIEIAGDADSADLDSMVYSQDALWFTGDAKVTRMEIADGVYSQLPDRMSMYKTSLNQLIPTGDTSISSGSGDPQYSKTPAGVKFQAASLSIDDEDFKDNLYITYAAVAKSMINTHFANMDGTDLMKLSDDERDILIKAGMEWPTDEEGNMSNQLEIIWDTARATFDFKVDPEQDKAKDDADKLEGLMKVAELTASDPTLEQDLQANGKKLNKGELFSEIIQLTSDNDKIVTDVSPEEEEEQTQQGGVDPETGEPLPTGPDPAQQQALQQQDEKHQMDMQSKQQDMQMKQEKHEASLQPAEQQVVEGQEGAQQPSEEEILGNIQSVMQEYGVDETVATAALAAEHQGFPIEDIISTLQKYQQAAQGVEA